MTDDSDRPVTLLAQLAAGDRVGKYLTVGAVGAVLDLTVSGLLVTGGVLSPAWAKVVGAECAILLMFVLNDRWTFAEAGRPPLPHRFRRLVTSNVVRSGGIAVQFLVVRALVATDVTLVVAGTDVWPLVTLPIAIACALVVNYLAESLITFRRPS